MAFYLANVDRETDECILWPYADHAGRGKDATYNYGILRYEGRTRRVHMLACERHHGPQPAGLIAVHAPVICHSPSCFNHRHVSWDTRQANMDHRVLDGTLPRGETHWKASLTWPKVDEMRARYAAGGVTYFDLAAEYGVSFGQVGRIIKNQSWVRGK